MDSMSFEILDVISQIGVISSISLLIKSESIFNWNSSFVSFSPYFFWLQSLKEPLKEPLRSWLLRFPR